MNKTYQIHHYTKDGDSLRYSHSSSHDQKGLMEELSALTGEEVKNVRPFLHTAKDDKTVELEGGKFFRVVEDEEK